MVPLIGALFGATIGLGVLIVVGAVTGRFDRTALTAGGRLGRLVGAERPLLWAAVWVTVFVVVWAATGWVAGGLIAVIVARVVPRIVATRRRRAAQVARIEAIASWCEMLRDTISAASGLHEAIRVTARVAPEPVAGPVGRLAARLHHVPLERALRSFADEVDHPIGDLVVASLLLAAGGQGGSMAGQLTELAGTARANATMRLRVEASRARVYTGASTVGGVFAVFAVGLVVLNRSYLAPFDDAAGQLVLLVIAAMILGGWAAMYRLGDFTEMPRVLHRPDGGPR